MSLVFHRLRREKAAREAVAAIVPAAEATKPIVASNASSSES